MNSHITGRWDENFDPENILTQVKQPDERFVGEIPDDSFVALLVTPRGVYHSDLQ
ncbi:hypothetical protein PENSPDRAFT_695530 [Peniophora sp. CONT]|nr:hypothetical protein PENSPDRAFT_695530 [Peniophora sp. CONT]